MDAADHGGIVYDSRDMARQFGKEHKNMLRCIDNIISNIEKINRENSKQGKEDIVCEDYFLQRAFVDRQSGKEYRRFDISPEGFMLLTMGFTGKDALEYKLMYIQLLNKAESGRKNLM